MPKATPTPKPKRVPNSPDGRPYPQHLRQYEGLDAKLLPIVAELRQGNFDDIVRNVDDHSVRAQVSGWLLSAQWRKLVTRVQSTAPWSYELGPEAPKDLSLA